MDIKKYNKDYYLKNKEKILGNSKKYYINNKEKILERIKLIYFEKYKNDSNYREKILKRQKMRMENPNNYIRDLLWHRENWRKKRMEVLKFVGGINGIKCVKCGFEDLRALQIDHINGGGVKEIKSFKDNKKYLEHIKKIPTNYQILCANCNWIKKSENNELKALDLNDKTLTRKINQNKLCVNEKK